MYAVHSAQALVSAYFSRVSSACVYVHVCVQEMHVCECAAAWVHTRAHARMRVCVRPLDHKRNQTQPFVFQNSPKT